MNTLLGRNLFDADEQNVSTAFERLVLLESDACLHPACHHCLYTISYSDLQPHKTFSIAFFLVHLHMNDLFPPLRYYANSKACPDLYVTGSNSIPSGRAQNNNIMKSKLQLSNPHNFRLTYFENSRVLKSFSAC